MIANTIQNFLFFEWRKDRKDIFIIPINEYYFLYIHLLWYYPNINSYCITLLVYGYLPYSQIFNWISMEMLFPFFLTLWGLTMKAFYKEHSCEINCLSQKFKTNFANSFLWNTYELNIVYILYFILFFLILFYFILNLNNI